MRDNSSTGTGTAEARPIPQQQDRERQQQGPIGNDLYRGATVMFHPHPERQNSNDAKQEDFAVATVLGINWNAPLQGGQPLLHLRVDALHKTDRAFNAPYGDQPGCWEYLRPDIDINRVRTLQETQQFPPDEGPGSNQPAA